MSFKFLVMSVRRLWWLVAACGALGLVLGIVIAQFPAKSYEATSVVLVGAKGDKSTDPIQINTYLESRMPTYAALAGSKPVLINAMKSLDISGDPEKLASGVKVAVQASTVLIDITVTNSDPKKAASLANALGTALDSQVKSVESRASGFDVSAEVYGTASVPTEPAGSLGTVLPLAGVAAGLLLGILAACAVNYRRMNAAESSR